VTVDDPARLPPSLIGLGDTPRPEWLTPDSIARVAAEEALPFPVGEYAERVRSVRTGMSTVDAVLVFRPSSVEYLCGYHTAETIPQPLLLTRDRLVLYVPDLEVGRAIAT
jgi:Xaa-Pro dipeptidase